MHNSGSPVIRKNAAYSQSSVIHPLIIIAVITIVYCTCSFVLHSVFQNRRAFCMHMCQYGLLKCDRGIFCELFTLIHYRHLQAVFWSWMTHIGSYIPQACSLRYSGISPLKVSVLHYCCPWEDSLSFRKTVHQRQDAGWMLLWPNISCTFFEQQEKVSMIVFH